MLMTRDGDERRIVSLAAGALPTLGRCSVEAVVIDGSLVDLDGRPPAAEELVSEIADLPSHGGAVTAIPREWVWAFPMSSHGLTASWVVVSAESGPSPAERYLVGVLAQQTGVALANARLHARERSAAADLLDANDMLRRSMEIHDRLTAVALAGQGLAGIARAVHELTGLTTLIEDSEGNVGTRAGPEPADPTEPETPRRRADVLRRAAEAGGPIRDGDRLLIVSRADGDLIRVLVLLDPDETAGEAEFIALEHAATVLAIELARFRRQAEAELHRRRNLVDALLDVDAGRIEAAIDLAAALDYDLSCRRRVVLVDGPRAHDERFFHAVRRAARDQGLGNTVVPRASGVVVLADAEVPWDAFRKAITDAMGEESCRVGIGGWCSAADQYRRSFKEAQLAARVLPAIGHGDGVICFDDLGVYQVLGATDDRGAADRLMHRWLGLLLDHDAHNGTHLVATLHAYLECGGNYDATAADLSVHRSTVKARLARIRDVGRCDLSNPDTRFNLQLACRAWRVREALEAGLADAEP
jgi:sugar diacid utilization regulator